MAVGRKRGLRRLDSRGHIDHFHGIQNSRYEHLGYGVLEAARCNLKFFGATKHIVISSSGDWCWSTQGVRETVVCAIVSSLNLILAHVIGWKCGEGGRGGVSDVCRQGLTSELPPEGSRGR